MAVKATGHTYRIEADQNSNYPTFSNPNSSVENCGPNASAHWGYITKLPPYYENVEYKEHSIIIRDSYDPNEKTTEPTGVGSNSMVKPRIPLNYTIHFQNTGNDTAYKVIILDSLSEKLDLKTLMIGGASAPFTVKFTGGEIPVINFIFDKINLVDSLTDEKKSHGFVSYSIMPYDTVSNGTVIKNVADIYFDYNPKIRTNTTIQTIDDRLPVTSTPLVVTGINVQQNYNPKFNITPNPANTNIKIFASQTPNENSNFIILNCLGQIVLNGLLIENEITIDIRNLPQGIYFVNLNGEVKKLIIQK